MQVPASLAGFSKLIYRYKQSLQVQSKQRRILCCGRCCCVAVVGAVLRSHLLRGRGVCRRATFCVAGAVVAWPWWASCCSHVCYMATVCVITLHFVLWALSLRGRGGRHVAVVFVASPWCVLSRRVVLWSGLLRALSLRGHSVHRVAVTFVASLRCVSLHRVVSRSGLLRGHRGHRVAVAFDAWPQGVSSHRVVSRSRLLRDRGGCLVVSRS
jgi:hypothetical protein